MRSPDKPQRRRPQKENVLMTVRKVMLSQVSGDVIEIGGGSGRSVPYFPLERITSLTIADRRFSDGVKEIDFGSVPVTFVTQTKDKLPLNNCSYDVGCLFLALTSMKDPYFALYELRRLLRPSGQVLFMEFYRPTGPAGLVFDGANLVRRVVARGNLNRNIITMLEVAGFQVESVSRCGNIFIYGSARKI